MTTINDIAAEVQKILNCELEHALLVADYIQRQIRINNKVLPEPYDERFLRLVQLADVFVRQSSELTEMKQRIGQILAENKMVVDRVFKPVNGKKVG